MNPVRELRQAAGLSQQELAKRSGVAQPNIAAYESGRRVPSSDMLNRLRQVARPQPRDALAAHRDELAELAERYHLCNLRVFGSVVRGTDTPASDLDLLVTPGPEVGLLTIAAFTREASELLGIDVDVVTDGGLRPDHEILATAVAV